MGVRARTNRRVRAKPPRDLPADPPNDPGRRFYYLINHPETVKKYPLDHPLVRISNDSRVIEASRRLKVRGVPQSDITDLIGAVARNLERRHWIESGTQREFVARRRALQRKLRGIANELAKHEDTRLLGLSRVLKNELPENDDSEVVAFCDRYDISEVLLAMASALEPTEVIGTLKSSDVVLKAPLQSRLKRKIKLESHLLLAAAEIVSQWPLIQTRHMRFPNREIEIVVSVATGMRIKAGTLTHLTKGKRRRYTFEK
jgi:hypothetical protein